MKSTYTVKLSKDKGTVRYKVLNGKNQIAVFSMYELLIVFLKKELNRLERLGIRLEIRCTQIPQVLEDLYSYEY